MAQTVGERIRMARESLEPANMRQIELAKRLDVSQGRLSNWERGDHTPPPDAVKRIAEVLGVSYQWLATGLGDARHRRFGARVIPLYGAISAGPPSSSIADPDELEVDAWDGGLPRWGRVIAGASMTSDPSHPDDLLPGDIAVFEERRAEAGHVVQAIKDGEDTVKVYRRIQHSPWLIPMNPEFEPIHGLGWHIRGVLVMRIRKREHDIVETVKYPHGLILRAPQRLTDEILRAEAN